ncbi:MAG TPA: hypothetical protein VFU78_07920 [Thermomicrobiales bacterium]|nr:hypothetical protein [Thermomicrobiales bacterium]
MQGITDSSDYILSASDIAAFPTLIAVENALGPGRPPFTDAIVAGFIGALDALSGQYPNFANTQAKRWLDQFYTDLINLNTSYGAKFPALYLGYKYGAFWVGTTNNLTSPEMDCFTTVQQTYIRFRTPGGGFTSPWDCNYHYAAWPRPGTPPAWRDAVNQLFESWGDTPPANVINTSGGIQDVVAVKAAQRAMITLARWTDANQVRVSTSALWTVQATAFGSLLAQPALDRDTFLFLLHLCVALGTATAATQQRVARVVSFGTDSPENPNDTFADQLVYFILMYLGDPRGKFGWANSRLQSFVHDLMAVILNTDPGSAALHTALDQQLKVLVSDASYPLQDPYNPGTGFNVRQTDTLAALNRAWAQMHSES